MCGELVPGVVHAGRVRRFIPACAGNSRVEDRTARAVHGSSPRVRGTLQQARLDVCALVGSSPRVRGTRACRRRPSASRTVHPRVCGELTRSRTWRRGAPGSSPRVRGTPSSPARSWSPSRFIPACAGNSLDHPLDDQGIDGSSPRVRGTRDCRRLRPGFRSVHPRVCGELGTILGLSSTLLRFIPACAGNSKEAPNAAVTVTVHPRVCGELLQVRRSAGSACGSSPRVRGTRSRWRLAPTKAYGSSPRVRGTREPARCRRVPRRFIPACAGNSYGSARICSVKAGSSPRVRGTPAPAPNGATL